MDAKVTKYTSNGTGRDSYISSNGGGLYSSYGSRPFHTTLRDSSPPITPDSRDLFFRTQTQWLRQKRTRRTSLDELSTRLSVPKNRKEKHPDSIRNMSPERREKDLMRTNYY